VHRPEMLNRWVDSERVMSTGSKRVKAHHAGQRTRSTTKDPAAGLAPLRFAVAERFIARAVLCW